MMTTTLHILSHSTNPITKEWWKYVVTRRILGIKRGPDAVRESLRRGLAELHIPYRYNSIPLSDTVVVLSGIRALEEALDAKKRRRVKKLITGPNVAIHPYDHGRLLCDAMIDTVLVPSKWTRDFWSDQAPELASKLAAWPAGVRIVPPSSRTGLPIIYNKLEDDSLLKETLNALGNDMHIFHYGSFSQDRYLKALAAAPYMVYLAESESQGLALQEAWAHDVPTLVNDSREWRRGAYSWHAPQINAPYLNEETGAIFSHVSQLPALVEQIRILHPKTYCDRELSDRVCAERLLKII